MTPTRDHLDTLFHDLQLVAHHLVVYEDAVERGLAGQAAHAVEKAERLVDALVEVVDAWREDAAMATAVVEAVDAAATAFEAALAAPQLLATGTGDDPLPDEPPSPPALAAVPDPEPEMLDCEWEGCDRVGANGFDRPRALAAHHRWHAREKMKADAAAALAAMEEAAPAAELTPLEPGPGLVVAEPDPPADPEPADTGRPVVKSLRGQKFVRCPEVMCSQRVHLDPEDTTDADIDAALEAHHPRCLARPQATPAAKRGGARR